MGVLQVLSLKFRKFRILEILNIHPWVCLLLKKTFKRELNTKVLIVGQCVNMRDKLLSD